MATKTFYVTRTIKHPLYATRMLTAGQELPLSGSAERLFRKLGVGLSEDAPRRAQATTVAAPAEAPKPKAKRTRRKK